MSFRILIAVIATAAALAVSGRPVWATEKPLLQYLKAQDCASRVSPAGRGLLGIGVLVQTEDGDLYLGKSYYTAAKHATVVRVLTQNLPVAKILWMGELRYRMQGAAIRILEANETSNHYLDLLASGLHRGDQPVVVMNHVESIPQALRSDVFQPIPYDPSRKHLIEALAQLPMTSDVRHSIGNAMARISAVVRVLSGGNADRARRALEQLRGDEEGSGLLIRHVALNLIEDGRLEADSLVHLIEFLVALGRPDVAPAAFDEMDLQAVQREMLLLDRISRETSHEVSVEIFHVPGALPSAE